ncbi:SDR family oxidoreductase [Caballeronia sp. SEWSISQ10-4 2]|uniref:SDR family oxidoreductase n=1 Tax=Caballeronia sp. SEWSISQ10-4 2 TaxID=2937438 RepID=UPI00264DD532|nr:SDR family oxidoreductase [Caballeronia sp. SEWSISQ10-4 2]MDN7179497.1 SDR family oxidoreductase [Caballeronia sp. SEWSISQ10-4 2]
MTDFNGKVAVVTGAGSGFGREFARAGAALGMKLVLADVQQDALHDTVKELEARGAQVIAQRVDVSRAEQVEVLAESAFSRFGAVHLLFNNAGVGGSGGLVWESTVQDWEWTLGVNLWGVVHGIRAFVPRMLAAARLDLDYRGHIANTASMAGLVNAAMMGTYSVSKHAVVSLSETLFHDLSLTGEQVRCSVLCPYFVSTGITRSERNRPTELAEEGPLTRSQQVAKAMNEKAVSASRVSAKQIAQMTFDAIRDGSFYIYSHPHRLAGVESRMTDLLTARNPVDPLAAQPEVRAALEAAARIRNEFI